MHNVTLNRTKSESAIKVILLMLIIAPVILSGFRGFQLCFVFAWSVYLYIYINNTIKHKIPDMNLVGITPMVIHYLIFGIGGIAALSVKEHKRSIEFGFGFEDSSVVLFTVLAAGAGLVFQLSYSLASARRGWRQEALPDRSAVAIVALVLVAVDLYVRYMLIKSGSYINWATTHVGDFSYRQTGALPQVQLILWPVLLSLLAGLGLSASGRRERVVWGGLTLLMVSLIFTQGSRLNLLVAFALLILHYTYLKNLNESKKVIKYNIKYVLYFAAAAVLFLGFVSPLIQEARYQARSDLRQVRMGTGEIMIKFATQYIPEAMSWSRLYGEESMRIQRGATLQARIGSYAAYGGAIVTRMDEGYPLMGGEDFGRALHLMVPRFIVGVRVPFDADGAVIAHYMLGRESLDAGATTVVDIYSYLGIVGIILIFSFTGFIIKMCINYSVYYLGAYGIWISVGLANNMIPIGNSFVYLIVAARNSILLVLSISISILLISIILAIRR